MGFNRFLLILAAHLKKSDEFLGNYYRNYFLSQQLENREVKSAIRKKKEVNVKREAETREKVSVAIYILVLIVLQAWIHSVLLHASLNQAFIIAIKRFLNKVEGECNSIGQKGQKSNAQKRRRTLKLPEIADWGGLKPNC